MSIDRQKGFGINIDSAKRMKTSIVELLKQYEDDGLVGDVELSFRSSHAKTTDPPSDDSINVHSMILALASPVFRGAFSSCTSSSPSSSTTGQTGGIHKIAVDETKEAWLLVLSRLYPIHPRQELNIMLCKQVLPICHKYNISSLLAEALHCLHKDLPAALDHKVDSPGYVFTWLQLADDLDLHDVRNLCIRKVRDLARFKLLDVAAFLHVPQPDNISKPSSCQQQGSYSVSSQSGHTYGECVRWCGKCRRWGCGKSSCPGGCGSTPTQMEATAVYFIDDQPELQPGVEGLTRKTLEQLLSIVIAVNSDSYVHEERPRVATSSV